MWKNYITDSITPQDQVIFYKFLREISNSGSLEARISSLKDITDFFVNVICDEKNNFQLLPIEGMQAIESLLLHVNIHLNLIVETNRVQFEKYNQIGPAPPPGRAACWEITHEEKVEFKVKAPPSQIKGLPQLWKIALEAKCEDVTSRAIELLNMLYTKLGEELEAQIAEISSNFVETAIEKLRIFYASIIKDNINRSREIVKLVRLIEEMLDESERRGNGGISPLRCLHKGVPMKVEVINYMANTAFNSVSNDKFPLIIHSNITYWQLKMLIAKKLQVEPEIVCIFIKPF